MLHQRVYKTFRLPESTHSFTQHATQHVMETCRTQHSDTAITKMKEIKARKGIPKNKQLWRKSGDFLGAELLISLSFFPCYLKLHLGHNQKGHLWGHHQKSKNVDSRCPNKRHHKRKKLVVMPTTYANCLLTSNMADTHKPPTAPKVTAAWYNW